MKKTNKLISVLLVMAMMLTMAPITVFAADNLTDNTTGVTLKDTDDDGYYEIGTAEQLYAFANLVNAGNTAINAELTADIVLNENVIAADGSLNGEPSQFTKWIPIGNIEAKYSGVFDGGNHTISGLFYHGTGEYAGFFGYIEGVYNSEAAGFVKNLGIVDSYFLLESTGRWFRTGGIVGYANKISVKNCYVIANFDLTTTYYNPSIYIGGIGGMTYYTDVRNCYTVMNVSLNYRASFIVETVGGITAASSNEKIIDCHTNYNSLGSYNSGTDLTGTTYNVSKEKFKSGEITYLLNGSTVVATSVWKQTIGEDDYPSFNGKYVDYDETKGYYNMSHVHSFDYSASGNTITAICTEENCYLNNADGGYVTLSAPADICTDGNAIVDNQLADKSVTVNVVYSTNNGSVPTEDGTYTASVTLGDATATVEFTLGHTPADAVKENEVPATESTTGSYDSVVYCSVCNAEISRETVIVPVIVAGTTISGNYVSFDSDTDTIAIALFAEGEETALQTLSKTGNTGAYSFDNVADGTYTIIISKADHVTRFYTVEVKDGTAVTQDLKIHLKGDITGDGKITVLDYSKAQKHVKKTTLLEGYEFDCGDVTEDGKISVLDYSKLLKHVKKTDLLW